MAGGAASSQMNALAPASSVAAISAEVERETRVAGVSAAPESLTPLQWTERYFAAKNKSLEQVKRLLEAAEGLFEE